MGFNTVALFLNDRTGDIQKHPERYVERLVQAMNGGRGDDGGGGMQILPSVHADGLQIIAAGANSIHSIGLTGWQATDEQIVRELADRHGYRLVRKSRTTPHAR